MVDNKSAHQTQVNRNWQWQKPKLSKAVATNPYTKLWWIVTAIDRSQDKVKRWTTNPRTKLWWIVTGIDRSQDKVKRWATTGLSKEQLISNFLVRIIETLNVSTGFNYLHDLQDYKRTLYYFTFIAEYF